MRQPLGQHFLRDANVIQDILTAAELEKSDTALEIGPGKAVLTEPLVARVSRLIAFELDRELAEQLTVRFKTQTKVKIIQGDFLKVDLKEHFPDASVDAPQSSRIKVLGNIPYSITAPIFEKLLAWPGWRTGVFLIQREVADRMRAAEGTKAFGILTLAVQLLAKVEWIANVPPEAFSPPPQVHSSVIRLRRRPQAELPVGDTQAFFDFAKAAFNHRRKTLVNSLAMATQIPKKQLSEWLQSQHLNPEARAESIAFADYVRIARPWANYRREIDLTGDAATSTITEPF